MRRLRRTMVGEDALRSRCSLYNLYSAPRIFASERRPADRSGDFLQVPDAPGRRKLNYDVGQECMHFWQLLAYVVAAQLQADGTVTPLPDEVTSDMLWEWMVEPHWNRFVEILTAVPPTLSRAGR